MPAIQLEQYVFIKMVYNLKNKSNESSLKKAILEILLTNNKGVKRSGN